MPKRSSGIKKRAAHRVAKKSQLGRQKKKAPKRATKNKAKVSHSHTKPASSLTEP